MGSERPSTDGNSAEKRHTFSPQKPPATAHRPELSPPGDPGPEPLSALGKSVCDRFARPRWMKGGHWAPQRPAGAFSPSTCGAVVYIYFTCVPILFACVRTLTARLGSTIWSSGYEKNPRLFCCKNHADREKFSKIPPCQPWHEHCCFTQHSPEEVSTCGRRAGRRRGQKLTENKGSGSIPGIVTHIPFFFALHAPAHVPAHLPEAFPGHFEAIRDHGSVFCDFQLDAAKFRVPFRADGRRGTVRELWGVAHPKSTPWRPRKRESSPKLELSTGSIPGAQTPCLAGAGCPERRRMDRSRTRSLARPTSSRASPTAAVGYRVVPGS